MSTERIFCRITWRHGQVDVIQTYVATNQVFKLGRVAQNDVILEVRTYHLYWRCKKSQICVFHSFEILIFFQMLLYFRIRVRYTKQMTWFFLIHCCYYYDCANKVHNIVKGKIFPYFCLSILIHLKWKNLTVITVHFITSPFVIRYKRSHLNWLLPKISHCYYHSASLKEI